MTGRLWTASDRRTADDGEYDELDERWKRNHNIEKTFLPIVQPHQYSPTRAATAAVVSVYNHCNIYTFYLGGKRLSSI